MDLSVEGKSERIPPGSHILELYNKVNEIIGITARLLEVGLANSEKCLFAASPEVTAELERAMTKSGIDVIAARESGQLVFITDRDTLLVNGRFDPYHLLSHHQTFIAQALREGWKAVRISMDMSWLTAEVATPQQILKYEAASDAVFTFQNAPIIALMQYAYAELPGALVVELLKLHPIAVVGKFIKRNPYYLNSEQYLLKILRVSRDKKGAGAIAV